MSATDTPDPVLYERGDALEDILPAPEGRNGADRSGEAIYELSEEEYWEWLTTLIEEGSEIDEYLDDVLDEIYVLEPSFYNRGSRRQVRELLRRLHEARTDIRAFEKDVEQLSLVFYKTDKIESEAADNAELTLSSVKRTYDRAYDLCLYKLDRISNGWITATNLLISLTILIVTVLFWMEFR